MKLLVVITLVAISAAAAWPSYMSDEPDGVSTHQKQHDVNYAFYKIFEPLRDNRLAGKAASFNPVGDISMYKDGGVAVRHLMDELTHGRLLEKKHWAVATNKRHLEEAIMLFEVFMQCKDWNCVASNGAYFRERVNEEEFIYAAYHAIKHSPLTQHVVLPAMYEEGENFFYAYHQLLNRYEAERISNYLPPLQELKLDEPLKEGFTPQTTLQVRSTLPHPQ
ncbi:hypothetical protein O3P69_003802 [Scylla paramamosain]|uniref:Hemocyanin N-terminal domain-containing protein n=1 Tax=Scylla paramamosain TaxID=85552 RepID=A0AAW0UE67_SCYPA